VLDLLIALYSLSCWYPLSALH